MTDFDSPWKEILEEYFEHFLELCFPSIHCEIDWSKGYTSKDNELQKLQPEAETGARIVDKLVQVYRKSGHEAWILIHVEVQNQQRSDFPERMFIYHYRLRDRYNKQVVSLAVLGDDGRNWRPSQYYDELFGCSIDFKFPIAKLLDYKDRESELESTSNPFGILVLAHLKSLETSGNPSSRYAWKYRLVKALYIRGRSPEQVRKLFRFIDWLIDLPPKLGRKLSDEIAKHEEETHMPYVTSVEKIGIEKGLSQGREEGREEGREQGREEGLRTGIRAILELRFPQDHELLYDPISKLHTVESLSQVLEASKTIATISELMVVVRSANKLA